MKALLFGGRITGPRQIDMESIDGKPPVKIRVQGQMFYRRSATFIDGLWKYETVDGTGPGETECQGCHGSGLDPDFPPGSQEFCMGCDGNGYVKDGKYRWNE